MKLATVSLALFSTLATTITASSIPRQVCPDIVVPTPRITADGIGVAGLQLAGTGGILGGTSGTAILTTSGYAGWNFGGGGLGYPWCPTSRWLNIGTSTHKWKPLTWDKTEKTTTWETGYSTYLTANATTAYAATSTFLACKPLTTTTTTASTNSTSTVSWTLFLLTDNVLPTASDDTLANVNVASCVKTRLFIGAGDIL